MFSRSCLLQVMCLCLSCGHMLPFTSYHKVIYIAPRFVVAHGIFYFNVLLISTIWIIIFWVLTKMWHSFARRINYRSKFVQPELIWELLFDLWRILKCLEWLEFVGCVSVRFRVPPTVQSRSFLSVLTGNRISRDQRNSAKIPWLQLHAIEYTLIIFRVFSVGDYDFSN